MLVGSSVQTLFTNTLSRSAPDLDAITTEKIPDSTAAILAYDMAFAKFKKEREENKKHA